MGKKRNTKQNNIKLLNEDNIVKINRQPNGENLFEVGNSITTDLAEAVAIMMKTSDSEDSIWKMNITDGIENIEPRKALYWLSGGDYEWITLHNYCKSWSNCEYEYQEEFGYMVMSIIKKAKTYKDIKDGFIRYLNLPTLYEFALSKDFIR
jgi:hypothetical protein